MKHLWRRLIANWVQFWTVTANPVSGFLDLIVNLVYMSRLRLLETTGIVVLVNSRREALLLRLLRLVAAIPWCGVRLVQRPDDLDAFANNISGGNALLVATSQLFSKQHQAVVALRGQFTVVVI